MKILILYFSGVGNTKMVATKIHDILDRTHDVTIASIETFSADTDMGNYDTFVIGFPTIHVSPAKPIMEFIEQVKYLRTPVPTFLFTTCGLYSANALRIFAQKCVERNIIPVLNSSYRCAATDGALIAPFMNVWFHHERKLDEKIVSDINQFIRFPNQSVQPVIPHFKLYSILNFPNKYFGQRFLPQIYTHKATCVSCGKCIADCPVKSISKDSEGYPIVKNKSCIHCYRCIHHCPKKALSLSRRHSPSKTFYN